MAPSDRLRIEGTTRLSQIRREVSVTFRSLIKCGRMMQVFIEIKEVLNFLQANFQSAVFGDGRLEIYDGN